MTHKSDIGRRAFLATSLAASLAPVLAVAGRGWAGCPETAGNPEGPFHLPEAPFRHQLISEEQIRAQGARKLRIGGQVLGRDCRPLSGVVVDVWHANPAGFYYGMEASPPLPPEAYLLRGRNRTDKDGRYWFDTVLPGHYRVSQEWTRPRHIHFKVSHPGHRTLITQLYFAGDPQIPRDPLVRDSLVILLRQRKEVGLEGSFDLVLAG